MRIAAKGEQMTENGKKLAGGIIRTVVKLFIAAAIVFWFFHKHLRAAWYEMGDFNFLCLVPALILTFISTWVISIRWRDLARTSGVALSDSKAFSLTMQGIFFSLVIPGGAIGGDVVKMAALSGHIKQGTRTEGFFSIFMDRLVGMLALFLVAPVLLFCSRPLFSGISFDMVPWLSGNLLWWMLMGICVAGLFAGAALLMHRQVEKFPGIGKLLDFADRRSNGRIARAFSAADRCAAQKERLIFWIVMTIFFVHLFPVVIMYIVLTGIGIFGAVLPVATAVVMGNIAGLIPVFPGGIGGRDVVTVALLASAGYPVDEVTAAQLFCTLLMVVFNLSGALFFICDRKNPGVQHE